MQNDREEQKENQESPEEKKERRRQRRVRNQIIAYVTISVLLVVIAVVFFLGTTRVRQLLKEYQSAENASVLAQDSASEGITIGNPDVSSAASTQSREEMLDEIAKTCIAEMPVEDKVAGLFVVTPEQLTGVDSVVKAGSSTQDALSKYAVGGIVYLPKNIKDKDQITQMISDTQGMSKYPLFFAVSEEGGKNSDAAAALGMDEASSASDLGASGNSDTASTEGASIGTYLNEMGFNLDFAPVANLSKKDSDQSVRTYGNDASKVSELSSAVVQGLQGTGVSACMKYFPVMGDTSDKAEDGIESTALTLDDMRKSEFLPFKEGIKSGTTMIMVSDIAAPNATGDNTPCSLSKVMITDELRNELGFKGIVITDALNSSAITDYYTPDQAAVTAVQAGADLLYMPENFQKAYDGLLKAVQAGTISEDRIDESLMRIYRIKYADKVDEIAADDTISSATSGPETENSSVASSGDSSDAGADTSQK
ncbi:MAG: beta-N-acetylhexosaminidase [Butyrivibrio sp.]|nr:beta-N-acetylhexosaminidase [Butyrivibrio sp.]